MLAVCDVTVVANSDVRPPSCGALLALVSILFTVEYKLGDLRSVARPCWVERGRINMVRASERLALLRARWGIGRRQLQSGQ